MEYKFISRFKEACDRAGIRTLGDLRRFKEQHNISGNYKILIGKLRTAGLVDRIEKHKKMVTKKVGSVEYVY